MKLIICTALIASVIHGAAVEEVNGQGPLADVLENGINQQNLMNSLRQLQRFANTDPAKSRTFGQTGQNATLSWIRDQLVNSNFYNVTTQEVFADYPNVFTELKANNVTYECNVAVDGPSGAVTARFLPLVRGFGCQEADFPPATKGRVVHIKRGQCSLGEKAAFASKAGAKAVIISNNSTRPLVSLLGEPPANLTYVPTFFVTQGDGEKLARLPRSTRISLQASRLSVFRPSNNLIAQTKSGDESSVVVIGAHSDAYSKSPGINDNGSGTVGILEVARLLAQLSRSGQLSNAVRFVWFTAEEFGLQGASQYVESLTDEEKRRIAIYLNFDMIASPNYVISVYDGDGSTFGNKGPTGSAQAEQLLKNYFKARGVPVIPEIFRSGLSDYGPFIDAGIPAGGIFTGADGYKTREQRELFGGREGEQYDACYHTSCDIIQNINRKALAINARAIAWTVGSLAQDASLKRWRQP